MLRALAGWAPRVVTSSMHEHCAAFCRRWGVHCTNVMSNRDDIQSGVMRRRVGVRSQRRAGIIGRMFKIPAAPAVALAVAALFLAVALPADAAREKKKQ